VNKQENVSALQSLQPEQEIDDHAVNCYEKGRAGIAPSMVVPGSLPPHKWAQILLLTPQWRAIMNKASTLLGQCK